MAASRFFSSLAIAIALFGAGCATVKPHEREHLADRVMQFQGQNAETALEAHILSNREGSFGGDGAGGGGCGCN